MWKHGTSRIVLELALALSLLAPGAWARSADRNLPVEIDAGSYVDDPGARQRVFSGGVVLRQGSLTARADEAVIEIDDAGELVHARMTGAPATWDEVLDDGQPLTGQARRIDYDFASDEVVLREEVVITRGTDRITGELVRYDLTTSRLDAGGEGRVRMRITPRERDPEDDEGR